LRRLAAAFYVACAVASGSCRRTPASPPPVAYDLAFMAPAADQETPWPAALFGTPAAVPWQAEGFVAPAEASTGRPYLWLRKSAELRVPGPASPARRLLLELAPHPGTRGQVLEVRWKERRLARLELSAEPRRYLVELPADEGNEQRLSLAFEKGTDKLPAYRRSLAASVYAAAVGPAGTAIETLARPNAPALLEASRDDGVPAIVQAGPGALHYVVRVPARAELRFTPRLHPASAGRPVALRVTLDSVPGSPQQLWQGPAGGDEVAVPIPASQPPGTLARLSLHVLGAAEEPAWVVWKAPRLLGEGQTAALPAAPPSAPADPRADALRRSLSEANVVLVILDAAGAKHVSAYGYARKTTPEIDRLAAEGVLFEDALTPAVYTLPAMASLWTSRYPEEHRNVEPRTASLARARLTLPDLLQAQGIVTAGFVANGMAGPGFGFDRSFDEFREIYREFGQRADADSFREVVPGWLEANRARRFFAYLHYREPHWPYDPKPPFNTRFGPDGPIPRDLRNEVGFFVAVNNRRRETTADEADHIVRLYDGNLAFVDQELGFLRSSLETLGLWERTVVIVTADHGEEMGEHGLFGHEAQLYEPALRIPLVIRFPQAAGLAGRRVRGLVDLVDLAPTIADVYGLLGRGGSAESFGGRTLLPMLFGAPGKPAVVSRTRGEQPRWSLHDGRYKLVYDGRLGTRQLFDVSLDPEERLDLAPRDPLLADFYLQGLRRRLLDMQPEDGRAGADTELSQQQLENLRALGYVH
jgi:arylsulfatase A-like enzyme